MSTPSQVHRITVDSNELRILLNSELIMHPMLSALRKKLTMAQLKESAGISGAYTKSNEPKSQTGKLESIFANEIAMQNESPEEKEAREKKELEDAMKELTEFQTHVNDGTAKL